MMAQFAVVVLSIFVALSGYCSWSSSVACTDEYVCK